MSEKFQNKYRIPSARWQSWDYSSEGLYFITINAAHHVCLFGSITDKEMHLSVYGQIVEQEWNKSFEIRTELFCDTFVIMPNHIHAILRIEYPVEPHRRAADDAVNNFIVEPHRRAAENNNNTIDTHRRAAENNNNTIDTHRRANLRCGGDGNGVAYREPQSISSFVAGFKSVVTARVNTLRQSKGRKVWQERFHDHVIRDAEECRRIGAYIDSNIINWKEDRYCQ